MRKKVKVFFDIKKEQEWLAAQKGWKLIKTNGIIHEFEESSTEFSYEFVYFEKSKKELETIKNRIQDENIEFVCNSSSWALFRKDTSEGPIQVYANNYDKYKMLIKKYNEYTALGACYICLGSTQIALSTTVNGLFGLSSALFYLCSFIFFISASVFKKYAKEYDDGTCADRFKQDKLSSRL